MKETFHSLRKKYEAFMEKQGFYWLVVLCCGVIAATALWTADQTARSQPQPPALQVMDSQAQTLSQVRPTASSPSPTLAPIIFSPPVTGKVLRSFSASAPVYFAHTGHWQMHAACDYLTATAEPVKAVADGTVVSVSSQEVVIRHAQEYESRYLGLMSTPYVKAGDPVQRGQTVGHAGPGPLWEREEETHLHLEVLRKGRPVDPQSLFP